MQKLIFMKFLRSQISHHTPPPPPLFPLTRRLNYEFIKSPRGEDHWYKNSETVSYQ